MKKATKIVLATVGGLSAAALGLGGILVYQANQVRNQATLYGVEPMTFARYNERYEYYVCNGQSASEVRTLIQIVHVHNADIGETDRFGEISIIGIDDISILKNSKKYNVSVEGYSAEGYINAIRIEEQS